MIYRVLNRMVSAHFVSTEKIDDILDGYSVTGELRNTCKEYMMQKIHIFEQVRDLDYNIVSLGANCLPHTIPTRWGLKPTKSMGAESCPFDLATHPPKAIVHLLKNNFEGYYDNIDCTDRNGKKVFKNTHFNITFNHDPCIDLSDEEIELFRSTLRRRVEAFKHFLFEKPVLYIHAVGPMGRGHFLDEIAHGLFSTLHEHNKNCRLLIIRFQKGCDDIKESNGCTIVSCKPPTSNYIWFFPEHYLTAGGLAYEHRLAKLIVDILKENFGAKKETSAKTLDDLFSQTEKSSTLHFVSGQFFLNNNLNSKAEDSFRRAIALKPKIGSYHWGLGIALMRQNKLDEAHDEIQSALESDPKNPEFLKQMDRISKPLDSRLGRMIYLCKNLVENFARQ